MHVSTVRQGVFKAAGHQPRGVRGRVGWRCGADGWRCGAEWGGCVGSTGGTTSGSNVQHASCQITPPGGSSGGGGSSSRGVRRGVQSSFFAAPLCRTRRTQHQLATTLAAATTLQQQQQLYDTAIDYYYYYSDRQPTPSSNSSKDFTTHGSITVSASLGVLRHHHHQRLHYHHSKAEAVDELTLHPCPHPPSFFSLRSRLFCAVTRAHTSASCKTRANRRKVLLCWRTGICEMLFHLQTNTDGAGFVHGTFSVCSSPQSSSFFSCLPPSKHRSIGATGATVPVSCFAR